MAMVDDPDWLLSHIRHSFITSDDTGMCEMVIQNNDLATLDEHRRMIREQRIQRDKKSPEVALEQFFSKSPVAKGAVVSASPVEEEAPKVPLAPSPDILSGWDFGVRRRSNTAQKLERIRKERQNRVKVKTVHWKQMPERFVSEHLDSMFKKKDLRGATGCREDVVDSASDTDTASSGDEKPVSDIHANLTKVAKMQISLKESNSAPVQQNIVASFEGFNIDSKELSSEDEETERRNQATKPVTSTLTKQLAESIQTAHNPFKDYSKFDGRGHEGTAVTQRINMFVYVYGEPPPTRSVPITVLVSGAKIVDLIGLSCWRYFLEGVGPDLKRKDVQGYSLHIAEDDGEVDYGFPPLDSNEPVSKFSFPTLALVEKHQVGDGSDEDGKFRESVFVKVNDYAGFSLIQVDDLSITMGEILKKAIKRRKGNKYVGVYRLEYQDKPGVVVDGDQTLDSTGVMEFCMIREHSARSAHNLPLASATTSQNNPPDFKVHTTPGKSVQFLNLMSTS